MKTKPDFQFEKKLWEEGFYVIGMDEVGRGAIAGPVAAAAVAFNKYQVLDTKGEIIKIDDSKKLKPNERKKADKWIKENALSWGIGMVGVSFINKHGIVKATNKAFRVAIKELINRLEKQNCNPPSPDLIGIRRDNSPYSNTNIAKESKKFLLIDAFYVKNVRGIRLQNQKAIIKGDEKSISIAASSIIAKVYRDKIMRILDRSKSKYNQKYGWSRNKGYGTNSHIEGIKKHGICIQHRKLFVRKIVNANSQEKPLICKLPL